MQPKNRNRKKEVKCSLLQERELYAITFSTLCFFYVMSVKIRDHGNLPLIDLFPYRSLLYILAAILKELLERV